MTRRVTMRLLALVTVIVAAAATAPAALADGDPGSDVLAGQNLFVPADAGVSIAGQAHLGQLLGRAARAGLPVRVAMIAAPADLGAVTGLWRKPQAYAQFLGIELGLEYRQRLLVVMPNGFGLNWAGHAAAAAAEAAALRGIPTGGGSAALIAATEDAVGALARSAGVRLPATGGPAAAGSAAAGPAAGGPATGGPAAAGPPAETVAPATAAPAGSGADIGPVPALSFVNSPGAGAASGPAAGRSTDNRVALIAIVVLVLGAGALLAVRLRRRRAGAGTAPAGTAPARPRRGPRATRRLIPGVAVLCGVAVAAPILVVGALNGSNTTSQASALQTNPYLDPGTPLSVPAPGFTLTDQFDRPVSLSSFHGKVVILAFTDSECTTICPMTTTAMLDAKAMLGSAGANVQLLGIDANPASTQLEDVAAYSQLHGMTDAWHFLTGSLPQLKRVWRAYAIEAAIQRGLISHTPALFVIGPDGREARLYMTQQSYAAVGQLGQILAREASSLLPGHPAVHSDLSYSPVPAIGPSVAVRIPRAGGGTVTLGPGTSAHLYLFFATWDQAITGLSGRLEDLREYALRAAGEGLPPLTAVDEGSVEPTGALQSLLHALPAPLSYPVAIDATGRIADGYGVQGAPWFVLTSADGRLLWYQEVSTSGWPSRAALVRQVRAALARAPAAPSGPAAAARELAGSPAPLAALHSEAGRLIGSAQALQDRIRALRGYPIVVNAWASWCGPCRAEFGLFASASGSFGRRVAFLGANTDDPSAAGAQAFLDQHPVSYPSYPTSESALAPLASIEGLPTTIFISPNGHVGHVHIGPYFSQGSLDGDITQYALGRG